MLSPLGKIIKMYD